MAETAHAIGTNGFKRVIFGILDDDENVVDTVYVDEKNGGSIELKTSGFAGQSNTVYASNIAYYVSDAGTGTGKVTLTILEMPHDVATKVLGDVYENKVYLTKSDTKQPYVAMIAESQDLDGNPMWVGIGKAKFTTEDAIDLKTAEEKGMTPTNISLTGSAITRKKDKLVKAKATSSDGAALSDFAKAVFPGFTGDLDNPTSASSSTPASSSASSTPASSTTSSTPASTKGA